MSYLRKTVFFMCAGDVDPVAGRVFQSSREIFSLEVNEIFVDGMPVMYGHFQAFDLAGIITGMGGENAPDGILTSRATGDVDSGLFGSANPAFMRDFLLSMEKTGWKKGWRSSKLLPRPHTAQESFMAEEIRK